PADRERRLLARSAASRISCVASAGLRGWRAMRAGRLIRAGGRSMELCVGDTERDLIAAPRVGDFDGAEWLVERYGERAYRLACRITGAVDDAEAATQNALLTAARAIHSVADEPAFESWSYRTVVRA